MIEYNRIIYPERAEYLDEEKFRSYKVFLAYWDDLSSKLKSNFEEACLRRVSKTLIVLGVQSSGKTLLANKLTQDFNLTSNSLKSRNPLNYDSSNIWHRLVSGFGKRVDLIERNTSEAALIHIENKVDWIEKAKSFTGSNHTRTCIIIADNCEQDYFVQGLISLSDADFLKIGRTDALIRAASQRFVTLCRNELRGAMIVLLTNDASFSKAFEDAVNKQHTGLVEVSDMPLPGPKDKEIVVRVNTNRLNPFSYWYCLDRAGVDEKLKVREVLNLQSGYKDAFQAVDQAIQKATPSRVGRPPKRCLITLFIMTNVDDVTGLIDKLEIEEGERNIDNNPLIDVFTYKGPWAEKFDVGGVREAKLLQSEWDLRIAIANNQFISTLLSGTQRSIVKEMINMVLQHHGPGTQATTISNHKQTFSSLVGKMSTLQSIDLKAFWSAGQARSLDYERELREIYPNYNTISTGFLQYRPDLVIEPYKPCEISQSDSQDIQTVNEVIRRKAIVCEFTAIKDLSFTLVHQYLSKKIHNYLEILQEQ